MEVLAIIPARSGSKGLRNKNIKKLNGHPLLAFSIAAGIKTTLINRTICSTDCQDIANIAIDYGAEIPFLRPKKFAQDNSLDIDVFMYTLSKLKKNEGYVPDLVINLRPTSPLRNFKMIKNAIEIMKSNPSVSSLKSIYESSKSPYKTWFKESNNIINPILTHKEIDEAFNAPRQVLPKTFDQTATIDIVKSSVIESGSMSGKKIMGMEIDEKYIIDIDSIIDFKNAEIKMASNPEDFITP